MNLQSSTIGVYGLSYSRNETVFKPNTPTKE